MLTINKDKSRREQIESVSIEQLVPHDHLVRKIESAINFDFIYDLVKTSTASIMADLVLTPLC
jgi:hypothetical protein